MFEQRPMKQLLWTLTICAFLFSTLAFAQAGSDYDNLVQKGKEQMHLGSADLAVTSANEAIHLNADRWEGYAVAGAALMSLKRYEEAADKLSDAIQRAPETKQPGLRDLRRQCLTAESAGLPTAKQGGTVPTTTQEEIVRWKTIENSANAADFQAYLIEYPQGAFVALAKRHLEDAEQAKAKQTAMFGDLPNSVWMGEATSRSGKSSDNATVLVFFLGNGDVLWRGYFDDKDDRPKLAQIKSDMGLMSRDVFLSAYRSQLRNAGTYTFQNGIVNSKFTSHVEVHCQLTFEGHRNQDVISGPALFVEDSTKESRRCQKWPQFDWHLERMFREQ